MDKELDITLLLYSLKKKIVFLIALTVAAGTVTGLITMKWVAPKYTASLSMYVYNDIERKEVTISDINMSVKLVNTYLVILNSNMMLSQVAEKSDLGYTAAQIKSMISAVQVNDTEVFQVNVTADNPDHARIIAQTIADALPLEILRVVKAGSVEIIDHPQPNPPQSSPNITKNAVIGCMLGLVIGVAFVLVRAMLDRTIRNETDLSQAFDLPILGTIPSFEDARH